MNSIKLSLVAALLAGTSLVADMTSDVEVSANVALTSHYVWRGMSQSDNLPAVQGGIDLGYKGAYVGVWGSNVDFDNTETSTEFDIYAGYAGEISGISYDIGAIQYMYPGDTKNLNFAEAYLGLGYDFEVLSVSAQYSLGIDADATGTSDFGDTIEVGVSVPLPAEITFDATYGEYNDKDTASGGNTNNFGDFYSVSLSKSFGKFDLSVAYTGMDFDSSTGGRDGDGKEDYLVATIGTSF
ncbi:TorF family putative porin [Sulfurimonas sp.]